MINFGLVEKWGTGDITVLDNYNRRQAIKGVSGSKIQRVPEFMFGVTVNPKSHPGAQQVRHDSFWIAISDEAFSDLIQQHSLKTVLLTGEDVILRWNGQKRNPEDFAIKSAKDLWFWNFYGSRSDWANE